MVSFNMIDSYETAMSALVVGLDLLMKYCKRLKYIKNIFFITDGRGTTDWSQVDEIAQQINAENIKLSIGDTEKYDDAIAIDVERYPRTKKASATSASKYVAPQESQTPGTDAIQGGSVALQRIYKIKRGEEEVEVEKDELDKAYTYGRTIVNVSDADLSVTKLQTTAELAILGFVEASGVQTHFW